jgi:hypothetical protein
MEQRAATKLRKRAGEISREIGTLFVAFAPLDAALSESRSRVLAMLPFATLGLLLIVIAIISELRRENDA